MKVAISNLGPVREADIELKPLTVFVGPNNLGKSFIATVLYAALSRSPANYSARYYNRALEFEEGGEDSESTLVHQAFDARRISSYNDVAEPLRDFFRKRLLGTLEAYGSSLVEELQCATGTHIHILRRIQKNVQQRPTSGWSLATPHGQSTSLSPAERRNSIFRRPN